jgi:hypothetical protein
MSNPEPKLISYHHKAVYISQPALIKELSRYGKEGWEVVSVVPHDSTAAKGEARTKSFLVVAKKPMHGGLSVAQSKTVAKAVTDVRKKLGFACRHLDPKLKKTSFAGFVEGAVADLEKLSFLEH